MNLVILLGNLGNDPELKYTPSGMAVGSFRLATSESYTDKSGAKQTTTHWHNIVAWGKLAELCNQYTSKGSSVLVEGKLTYRNYDKKDGTKAYVTEVVANSVKFIDKAPKNETQAQPQQQEYKVVNDYDATMDIPF